MNSIIRTPDDIVIYCDGQNVDTEVITEVCDGALCVKITATKSKPKMICLRWNGRVTSPVRILGDKWERSYGDLEWKSLSGEFFMPWYFLMNDGASTVGYGVKVRPNSFVSFQCDGSGITAWLDVRSGGIGVDLSGRVLEAATFVCKEYTDMTAFEAAKKFCTLMCDDPIFPREPVYGSNNWYYAYGKSSYDEITDDAKLIASLAGKNPNPPFMVIDDGWQINSCDGPWEPSEAYGDMKKLADEFKRIGVRPGIWYRPLHDSTLEAKHPEYLIDREKGKYLDPSHPRVQDYLRKVVRDIKSWGFELIKHDYSTFDLFGKFGYELNGTITNYKNWSFYDKTKTSAEIVLDFYRLLREEAGDMYIIGCNTISHLCAGLVEINRTGNDTSGRCWNATRANGINTLAFRLCQNDTFYKVDADCVGLLGDNIDWALNRQWLDLLSKSGSPLFVSMQPSAITPEMMNDLKTAFEINSKQSDTAIPLDWMYNNQPQTWEINGEKVEYDFILKTYPSLAKHGFASLSADLIF